MSTGKVNFAFAKKSSSSDKGGGSGGGSSGSSDNGGGSGSADGVTDPSVITMVKYTLMG